MCLSTCIHMKTQTWFQFPSGWILYMDKWLFKPLLIYSISKIQYCSRIKILVSSCPTKMVGNYSGVQNHLFKSLCAQHPERIYLLYQHIVPTTSMLPWQRGRVQFNRLWWWVLLHSWMECPYTNSCSTTVFLSCLSWLFL